MRQPVAKLWFFCSVLFLSACQFIPPLNQTAQSPSQPNIQKANFQIKQDNSDPDVVTFPNAVPPQPLTVVSALPSGSPLSLDLVTGTPTAQQIKIPAQGDFQLITQAGSSYQILDQDATDGVARIQLPAHVYDLYLRPETVSTPTTCATPAPTGLNATQILDQLDQAVVNKANALIAAGQGQCAYLPPTNQRQNANCNSTSSGLQCSGPLNKTLVAANCPEMAVYGGAMNLNNALPNTKIFAAVQNNLTINQSVQGILSTRGDLNTSLNNQSALNGVFVGARSNNLNMGGTTRLQGLYSVLNQGSLSFNLNQNAQFEGMLCTSGQVNLNRNAASQLIYNPNQVTPWQADVSTLGDLICAQGNRPYTQTVAPSCASAPAQAGGSFELADPLYYVKQNVDSATETGWYHLPGRPVPVPADWYSEDGLHILNFKNENTAQISLRWLSTQTAVFPMGLREIGPAGGVVELPGVATLTIPPGAISAPTVVRMTQLAQGPDRTKRCQLPNATRACYSGEEYLTPIVQVQPMGIVLTQEANLEFVIPEIYSTLYSGESAFFFSWLATLDIEKTKHLNPLRLKSHLNIKNSIDILKFGYFAKLIDMGLKVSQEDDFNTQKFHVQSDSSDSLFYLVPDSSLKNRINDLHYISDSLSRIFLLLNNNNFLPPIRLIGGEGFKKLKVRYVEEIENGETAAQFSYVAQDS
ncbi:MAG: hypothetical protein ACO1RX_17390 [Candidatus Sericytochromatia bacterium]